jgi:hypothetical protein
MQAASSARELTLMKEVEEQTLVRMYTFVAW